MVTKTSLVSSASGLLLLAAVAMSGCTPRPDGPGPAAEKFFGALAVGDTATAAQLSDNPNEAREALNAAWAGLQASHLDTQILNAKYAEDTGTVGYRFTWHLPKNRTWTYDGQLKMARDEGRWEVRWTTTGLHPKLGEHQTFALRADAPRRASVNELGGSDVLVPGYLYHYTLDATQAGSGAALIGTARAIVDVLHPFNGALNDPQLLAEQASSATQPLDLVTLHPDDNDKVFPAIGRLPGVVITPQPEILPTDPHFASAVMSEVKKAVVDQLDGEAGWRVVSVNQNGVEVEVLHEVPGSPAPSISVTLDRVVQNAAQRAVDTRGGKAMMVVIKPSTGEILAIAQNGGADADGLLATTGLFPPGSTFKMVTAGAAIDRDMATPNTMLGCPGHVDIGHRTIPNYGGFDLGVVPMSRAFASSCNTTFAELSSKLPPRGSDAGGQPVRDRAGLPGGRHHHGDRVGAPDGGPRRAHRRRLRPGQGAGQPVRHGPGGGDRRRRQDPDAAAHRGSAYRRSGRYHADQPEDGGRAAAHDAAGGDQRDRQGDRRLRRGLREDR